jgi:hypothetical protein
MRLIPPTIELLGLSGVQALLLVCRAILVSTIVAIVSVNDSGWAANQVRSEQLVADRLMTVLYGEPGQEGIRIWHVPDDLALADSQGMAGASAEVRSVLARAFRYRGHDRSLLVAGAKNPKSTCHYCRVLIDATTFEKNGGEWHLRTTSHGLTMAGTFGTPPKVEFRQLGPDEFGFALIDQFGGQGGTEIHLSLYRASNTGFDLVLAADTQSENNPLAVGIDDIPTDHPVCKEVDYSFTPLRSTTNSFFDFSVLIKTGARAGAQRGSSPCDIPIQQSPNYREFRTRAVLTGTTYCQKKRFADVGDALRVCER